jgi:hypothetical protein
MSSEEITITDGSVLTAANRVGGRRVSLPNKAHTLSNRCIVFALIDFLFVCRNVEVNEIESLDERLDSNLNRNALEIVLEETQSKKSLVNARNMEHASANRQRVDQEQHMQAPKHFDVKGGQSIRKYQSYSNKQPILRAEKNWVKRTPM